MNFGDVSQNKSKHLKNLVIQILKWNKTKWNEAKRIEAKWVATYNLTCFNQYGWILSYHKKIIWFQLEKSNQNELLFRFFLVNVKIWQKLVKMTLISNNDQKWPLFNIIWFLKGIKSADLIHYQNTKMNFIFFLNNYFQSNICPSFGASHPFCIYIMTI